MFFSTFIWHQKSTTSGWALRDENAMGTYYLKLENLEKETNQIQHIAYVFLLYF